MYSLVSKRVLRDSVNRVSANRSLVSLSTMRFAGDTRKLEEKEKGDERLYFTKQEGKLIPFYHISIA